MINNWNQYIATNNDRSNSDMLQQFIERVQPSIPVIQPRPRSGILDIAENAIWPPLSEECTLNSLMPDVSLDPKRASLPCLIVKADIDSVYKTSHSLSNLVRDVGENNKWTLESLTSAYSADFGSRFCVNSSQLRNPAYVKNSLCKTVPLEWFPNVKIGVINIQRFSLPMNVHMYFMGVQSFTCKSYFSRVWMAVVNSMLNNAREVMKQKKSEAESVGDTLAASEFANMAPFQSRAGRKAWTKHMLSYKNRLSHESMLAYADEIHNTLDRMASGEDCEDFHFEKPELNGIHLEDKQQVSVSKAEMIAFAKALKKGIVFTASLAGSKSHFQSQAFATMVVDDEEEDDEGQKIGQDVFDEIGLQYMDKVETYLASEQGRNSGFDSELNFPPYDTDGLNCGDLLERWQNILDVELNNACSTLTSQIKEEFSETFPEKSHWYIDIGMEIMHSSRSSESLFIDTGEAKTQLDQLMTT